MWPASINQVAPTITEDLIGLFHDDTFVYDHGIVDKYFQLVEDTAKVCTAVHGIYSNPDILEEIMLRRWPDQLPIVDEVTGDPFYSFYCHFTFLTRELMHQTSMDFGEYHRAVGEYCPILNFVPRARPWAADTNFLFNLELYKAGAKFVGIHKENIAQLYNLENYMETFKNLVNFKTGIFSPDCRWVHLQTLAYHIGGLYWDMGARELLEKQSGRELGPMMADKMYAKDELVFRTDLTFKLSLMQEFMTCMDYTFIDRYYQHAKKEINWIINTFELDRGEMAYIRKAFHQLFMGDI
jgi:hypothetical protein